MLEGSADHRAEDAMERIVSGIPRLLSMIRPAFVWSASHSSHCILYQYQMTIDMWERVSGEESSR
jgi:hypothetical protein